MAHQYADVNDLQFAGLLQVATAAADAQQRSAQALGKRRRDDDSTIDHQLRQQPPPLHPPTTPPTSSATPPAPVLQNAAAVIFREPSEKSKKYSRPPLGKVFTDLQLPPESFLKLQHAVKTFMLDSNYPERRDVVGQRKENGNNDVAKLKLWACVGQFLEMDDNGERYFGYEASMNGAAGNRRSSYWPQDKDKIMKLCMPLFRKMVTNERQRLYALETRKQDPTRTDRLKQRLDETARAQRLATGASNSVQDPIVIEDEAATAEGSTSAWPVSPLTSSRSPETSLTIHINIVSKESAMKARLVPRITVPSSQAPDLEALYSLIQSQLDLVTHRQTHLSGDSSLPYVHVLTQDGQVILCDDGAWTGVLQRVGLCEWLDGEIRVVVEI